MNIRNQFIVDAPITCVWSAIRDPKVVAPCIPGCEDVEVIDANAYKARMQVKVGPIVARFNLDMRITEESPPQKLTASVKGEEGSRASTVRADIVLLLGTCRGNPGTEVTFLADVAVVGRLSKFGFGIMKKKSQEVGDEFARRFGATVHALEA